MTTAAATFSKKGCYHSELRDASPLTVCFTSDVKASKYAGKPPYIEFKVEGDDATYQYQVENGGIEALLKGTRRNEWVEITATGTREDADIEITYLAAQPPAQQQQGRANGSATPPPTTDDGNDTLARVVWQCLEASHQIITAFEKKHGPMTENHRAVAIHLAIEHFRGNRLPISR